MDFITLDNLTRYHNNEKSRMDKLYVKQEVGKGLSENDFTNALKKKLDDLQAVMQLKGRVDSFGDLPPQAENGDVYLVGQQQPYEEYVRIGNHWEALGSNAGQPLTSYNVLTDKPSIGGVELIGNKTLADIGIEEASDLDIDGLI